MYVVVIHEINDLEAMMSRGESLGDPRNAPPGVRPRQFFPSVDGSRATCLWEADSVDAVRDYTDSTLGDSSENSYFEINSQHATGLPEAAAAPQA
jgi:hypothetical protein